MNKLANSTVSSLGLLCLLLTARVCAGADPDCLSACRVLSVPFPLDAVQPVACSLFDTHLPLQTAPVVAGQEVVSTPAQAAEGSVACSFAVSLRPGFHSLTATAIAADGSESGHSAPLEFSLDAGGVLLRSGGSGTQFSPAPSR